MNVVLLAALAPIVSGTLDPNTNEHWGEEAMRGLSIARFIEQASMDGVDVSCKDRVKLPPFALPEPQAK